MPLATIQFNPQAGYNGSYRIDFVKQSDLETVINSVMVNPPLSTPVIASATVPTVEPYRAFIYSMACNAEAGGKLVGQAPITPVSVCAPPSIISASASDDSEIVGSWAILNTNLNFNITGLRINGVDVEVPEGFFPILPGQNKTFDGPVNTTLTTITVMTNENGSSNGAARVESADSLCQTFDGSGNYTFTNVEIDADAEISIVNNLCA